MSSDIEALRNKVRNDLLNGNTEFVDQVKTMFKTYSPVLKASGVNLDIDIDKLSGKELFDLLSQDNMKKHIDKAMQLGKLLGIKGIE
jgi:hypothetical protein